MKTSLMVSKSHGLKGRTSRLSNLETLRRSVYA